MLSWYQATFVVCGLLTATAFGLAYSQEGFNAGIPALQAETQARMSALGFCDGCTKAHGAPGPVMGVAGLPLMTGYGLYVLWRRRRSKS